MHRVEHSACLLERWLVTMITRITCHATDDLVKDCLVLTAFVQRLHWFVSESQHDTLMEALMTSLLQKPCQYAPSYRTVSVSLFYMCKTDVRLLLFGCAIPASVDPHQDERIDPVVALSTWQAVSGNLSLYGMIMQTQWHSILWVFIVWDNICMFGKSNMLFSEDLWNVSSLVEKEIHSLGTASSRSATGLQNRLMSDCIWCQLYISRIESPSLTYQWHC